MAELYSQYSRHLLTAKHKFLTNPNRKSSAANQQYKCSCGKTYKHYSSLCAHRKKCEFADNSTFESINEVNNIIKPERKLIMELIKQNQDFKCLLVEQQKENQSLQNNSWKQSKTVVKTINNTTNNNQKNSI